MRLGGEEGYFRLEHFGVFVPHVGRAGLFSSMDAPNTLHDRVGELLVTWLQFGVVRR